MAESSVPIPCDTLRPAGRVFQVGRYWAIEVPQLGVFTQGFRRTDAFGMLLDAIRCLAPELRMSIHVEPGGSDAFVIWPVEATDRRAWNSFVETRRNRND